MTDKLPDEPAVEGFQEALSGRPNAKAIAEIAEHYCIQCDPRHTAEALGAVMAECARRLCEGHVLKGDSLECYLLHWCLDDYSGPVMREGLVAVAAGAIEMMRLIDGKKP